MRRAESSSTPARRTSASDAPRSSSLAASREAGRRRRGARAAMRPRYRRVPPRSHLPFACSHQRAPMLSDQLDGCRIGNTSFDYRARTQLTHKEMTMEYALLIYGSEAEASKMTPAEGQAMFQGYMEFTKWLEQSGKSKDGRPLERVANATTVRVRNGKTTTTDGPFAETKEQLGGFYLVEAKDLDDAIAIAAKIPGARHGCIGVPPIMKNPGM